MYSHLQELRKLLSKEKLDAILISSLPNIIYLTHFSGFTTTDRDAFLLITQHKQYIFTHGIYKEAAKQYIKEYEFISILRENPISVAIKKIIADEKIKNVGFESFDIKVNEYERLVAEIDKNILRPTDLAHKLRIIKSSDEIAAIKSACELGDNAFAFILEKIKTGVTENELAVELEYFIKKHNAELSFPTIVAFGENAAHPHHVTAKHKLKKNTLVLFDFGVRLNNYCSDMTRTIFFGKASDREKHAYNTVIKSQQNVIVYIKNTLQNGRQLIGKNVDACARNYIVENGYPSFPHSLGHGIGIDVHEAPRLTMLSEEIIKNGMVFSLEPGIYLPGEFGIRIEDLFAIENDKLIQLTKSSSALIELY
jgi:Xaa-Pro aminopeptidase